MTKGKQESKDQRDPRYVTVIVLNTYVIIILSCSSISHSFFPSLLQGYPGEKGTAGSSDIIDFNGKLLDAFQVSNIKVPMRPDLWLHA